MSEFDTYLLTFSSEDWSELYRLTFEPFEFEDGEPLTHGQWMALATMALGEAQLLDEDYFDGIRGRKDKDRLPRTRAARLRCIARRILDQLDQAEAVARGFAE